LSEHNAVLVGVFNDTVWSKVVGRATFLNSGNLKTVLRRMIDGGRREIVIDLAECELMDSTFMGTLAGIALHLRDRGEGHLQVVRANPRNEKLLRNLGLDQIFTVRSPGDPDCPVIPREADSAVAGTISGPAGAEEMLEAHQALIEADAANAARFQDVVELLQRENEKTGSP
jgi:anti-anti-sigma factor